MDKFVGIMPAVVTPLTAGGAIIEKALRKHLDYLLENGSHGFYIGGSTGEGLVLPADVREHAAEIVADHIKPYNKTLIVHVGAVDTITAVRLSKHSEQIGADAIASVPPFYYRVDEQAVYNFYQEIAESVAIPVIIYNIPELTNITVHSVMAQKMRVFKNIIGIKYSSGDLSEMRKMKEIGDGKFKVFFGVDQILLAGLITGADGGIGGTYNCMPKAYVEVYEAAMNNDWIKAASIQNKIAKYFHIMMKYKSSIAAMKTIMTVIHGMDIGHVTHPLRDLTSTEKESLLKELKEEGFFDFIGISYQV